jgi:DNA polymerase-4
VIDPLPVGRLWGVGPKTEARLAAASIRTVAQLRQAPTWVLQRALGSEADHLTKLAQGIDPRPVVPDREARSVGAEDTFESDVTDLDRIEMSLLYQSERVATRLRRAGLVAAGVVLKYKTYDFKRLSRQAPLPTPSSDGTALFTGVRDLLHRHPPPAPLRLCGVGTYGLGPPAGPELFETEASRRAQANAAFDAIRSRYGDEALVRARLLGHRARGGTE